MATVVLFHLIHCFNVPTLVCFDQLVIWTSRSLVDTTSNSMWIVACVQDSSKLNNFQTFTEKCISWFLITLCSLSDPLFEIYHEIGFFCFRCVINTLINTLKWLCKFLNRSFSTLASKLDLIISWGTCNTRQVKLQM